MQDNHIFEICRQAGIDYKDLKQVHLLYFVFEFIQKKNVVNEWQFRSPNQDSNYWINHKEKRVTSEYPYLAELQKKLQEHIAVVEQKVKNSRAKDLGLFKDILDKPSDDALTGFVTKIRAELTKQFLVDRCKYMEQMYVHLKKRIERRLQNLKNRQNISINEQVENEVDLIESHKPVLFAD